MMTRQKSRLLSASDAESSAQIPKGNLSMKSKTASESDLIGLKHNKLKELFADELITENDENIKLQADDNQMQLDKEVEVWKPPFDKPEQRILNSEMTKNVEVMQPLMTMDKELCPISSEAEAEDDEEEDDEQQLVLKPENLSRKQKRARTRVLLEKNYGKNNIKLLKTPRGYVKKITYFDTRYFIKPKKWPSAPHQQSQGLGFPLVKLANASTILPLPSNKWSSKVTLYKVLPTVLKRHTLTMFSGDLKIHQIPEQDRQKYQPSSVIFRREATPQPSAQAQVIYDRTIIFRPKHFCITIDGNQVQLNGAPDAVTCKPDVIRLLDIIDSISMSNPMVEIVAST